MALALELLPQHGYVLAVMLTSVLIHHFWMAMGVVRARKSMEVWYPNLYAPPGHKYERAFNCIQRAHQNSLENQPAFLALLAAAGTRYPVAASCAGAVYLVGRVAYFLGYSAGRPAGRHRGAFQHLAYVALMVMVGRWAAALLLPLWRQ